MTLRILVLTPTYPLQSHPEFAITPWLWRILQEARSQGFQILVLASSYRGDLRDHAPPFSVVRYRYAPAPLETLTHEQAIYTALKQTPWKWLLVPSLLLGGARQAAVLRHRFRPHLVHVHWPVPFVLQAMPLPRVPWLLTFHGSDLALLLQYPGLRRLFAPLLRRAAAITVNSGFTRDRLQQLIPGLRRVEVLPLPPAMKIPPPDQWPARDPHRLLFVGRFIELKGGDILLRAFQQVVQAVPEARLVMVGSGPEEARWRALARELGVADRVVFRGRVPPEHLVQEYPRAAVVVVPSYEIATGQTEALGVVAIEAQAFGTPVVASRTGGLPEVVLHGETGLLVPERDPEALARALIRLLRDPELRHRMGENARKHYEEHFSAQSLGHRLAHLYRSLVRGRDPDRVN